MLTRRRLFIGAAASLICAPAIVRCTNLMPIKAIQPELFERHVFGFVERLAIDVSMRCIAPLQRAGHSYGEIALMMNQNGSASAVRKHWTADAVAGFVRRDGLIKAMALRRRLAGDSA